MPQVEADYATCQAGSGALRRRFTGRNFYKVFEYILLCGRGIRNTLIFCTLSVLAALLVNPLAAYADFMMAFILCQEPRMWTLMVWLFKLQGFAGQGVAFASLTVAALPTLAMFLLCQNLIIRGIVVPTEK